MIELYLGVLIDLGGINKRPCPEQNDALLHQDPITRRRCDSTLARHSNVAPIVSLHNQEHRPLPSRLPTLDFIYAPRWDR
jgi:hypothetical protein